MEKYIEHKMWQWLDCSSDICGGPIVVLRLLYNPTGIWVERCGFA